MEKIPEIQSRRPYTDHIKFNRKDGHKHFGRPDVRSPLAKELHTLICQLCLRSRSDNAAEQADMKLQSFLENKAVLQPSILLEESVNGCSHFIDALHLPFSKDIECNPDLRAAKAQVLFDHLRKFCRGEATRNAAEGNNGENDLTWQKYAWLLTHSNKDRFTPLLQAVDSGNLELFKDVLHELVDLRARKVIDSQSYAQQLTGESLGHYVPLTLAANSGNKEMFDHIAAELFHLHKNHAIDDKAYARQFVQDPSSPCSPMFYAVKRNNAGIYLALSHKLEKLYKQGMIDGETYARQFTQPSKDGFTPLQEALFSGNTEIFGLFVADLKNALRVTSGSHEEYVEKYQRQLEAHSRENWNIFHCATMTNTERRTPNPLLVEAVLAEFHEAFGDKARSHIVKLYREETRTEQFRPAFHDEHPQWLEKLLSLSDSDPVRPMPRHR